MGRLEDLLEIEAVVLLLKLADDCLAHGPTEKQKLITGLVIGVH